MKILQINSHYNQGGAARIVACIHRQLLEDGEEARARKKKMSSALIKIMKYICLHCCAGSQD